MSHDPTEYIIEAFPPPKRLYVVWRNGNFKSCFESVSAAVNYVTEMKIEDHLRAKASVYGVVSGRVV